MLPFAPVSRVVPVQPLLDTVEQTVATQAGSNALEQFEPGQRLRGEVAGISNGIARVRVNDTLLAMKLPPVFRVGDPVDLTFVSRAPSPSFQLNLPASVAGGAALANAAPAQVLARGIGAPPPATPRTATPARTDTTTVQLSETDAEIDAVAPRAASATPARNETAAPTLRQTAAIRYLDTERATARPESAAARPADVPRLSPAARLVGTLAASLQPGRPATLAGATPILPHPVEHPAEMAAALKSAVARSGLFYESHLIDWLHGRDTTAGLMQEPQNRPAGARLPAAQTPAAAPAGLPQSAAQNTAPTPSPLSLAVAAAASPGAQPTELGQHAPLVAQQLQMLENPTLIWRGDLWPGQRVEWRLQEHVEDDAEREPRGEYDTESARGWSSSLELELPRLGNVRIGLALDAAGEFRIQLGAAGAALAELGRNANDALAALAAAGCRVRELQVSEAGDEHGHA